MKDRQRYSLLLQEFTEGLQQAHIDEWIKAAEEWEVDVTKQDPYFVAPSGECLRLVSLQILTQ
jgi:hypothetical protein